MTLNEKSQALVSRLRKSVTLTPDDKLVIMSSLIFTGDMLNFSDTEDLMEVSVRRAKEYLINPVCELIQ